MGAKSFRREERQNHFDTGPPAGIASILLIFFFFFFLNEFVSPDKVSLLYWCISVYSHLLSWLNQTSSHTMRTGVFETSENNKGPVQSGWNMLVWPKKLDQLFLVLRESSLLQGSSFLASGSSLSAYAETIFQHMRRTKNLMLNVKAPCEKGPAM